MPTKKTLLGGAAIAVAIALIGAGVWAAFTDTESTDVTLDTGQLDIVGAADITVSDLAPGDVVFRDIGVDVPAATNDGNLVRFIDVDTVFGSETVGAEVDTGDPDPGPPAAPGSLWSGTNGIQVVLAVCDGGTWTLPAANSPLLGDLAPVDGLDDSITCSGTILPQASQPVNTFGFTGTLDATALGVTPTATGTIPDGSNFEILAQFTLPSAADNGYENATVNFDIEFDAIQRAGVNR